MNDSNGTRTRPLTVLAIIERKDRPAVWVKVGAAFPNRDGSTTLLLDAFPIGTNKLQIREEREWAPRAAANGNGFAPSPAYGAGGHAEPEAES